MSFFSPTVANYGGKREDGHSTQGGGGTKQFVYSSLPPSSSSSWKVKNAVEGVSFLGEWISSFLTFPQSFLTPADTHRSMLVETPLLLSDNMYISADLYVAGSMYKPSDEKWKHQAVTLEEKLEAGEFWHHFDQLKPCHYVWKSSGQPDVGFIAQEVAPLFPEWVHTDSHTTHLSLNYHSVLIYLVHAVQLLKKRVDHIHHSKDQEKEQEKDEEQEKYQEKEQDQEKMEEKPL